MHAAKSVTEEFLEQQVSLLGAGDTAGLAERYAPDATFVRFDRIAVGREQIKQLFDDYLDQKPDISATDAPQTTDDVIFLPGGRDARRLVDHRGGHARVPRRAGVAPDRVVRSPPPQLNSRHQRGGTATSRSGAPQSSSPARIPAAFELIWAALRQGATAARTASRTT